MKSKIMYDNLFMIRIIYPSDKFSGVKLLILFLHPFLYPLYIDLPYLGLHTFYTPLNIFHNNPSHDQKKKDIEKRQY